MLSFVPLDSESALEIRSRALAQLPSHDAEYLEEVLASFLSLCDEDIECAVTLCDGCLLVRVFDMGRYSFVYPIALCEDADEGFAILSLCSYAVKEEIPLVITDVPTDCISSVVSPFRHVSLDIEDDETMSYRASVLSELALLDVVPSLQGDRIELTELSDADEAAYGALCRDRAVNEYWGYDYRDDADEGACDSYFLSEALAEYNRSTALTLAVRRDGVLIGDAVFHAFDLRGGAEVAFRIMTEHQGQGLGRELLSLLTEYAVSLGLCRLRARVMNENVRSLGLLRSLAKEEYIDEKITVFEIEI